MPQVSQLEPRSECAARSKTSDLLQNRLKKCIILIPRGITHLSTLRRNAFVLFFPLFVGESIWVLEQSAQALQAMGPETLWQVPSDCGDMSVWDAEIAMCMPLPMAGMPMRMFMLHGNLFGTQPWQQGPRGRQAFSSSQMIMMDAGTSIGDTHYLNVDLMLTAEKWTVPSGGSPLLLQIGDQNLAGVPYLDAQHPHSSPIMGLTFSDTIFLGQKKNHIKLFFAPRGETTDGPLAFPHRATGVINPDAPLGHHVGQDVSHISSTVLGFSLKFDRFRFESSTFYNTEFPPDQINLPIGIPDSFSSRFIYEWSNEWTTYVSFSRLSTQENRHSASNYTFLPLSNEWMFYNSLIWGWVTNHDGTPSAHSFIEEFLFRGVHPRIWGRIEILQRTGAQLQIPSLIDSTMGQWVAAVTLGYTYNLSHWKELDAGLGVSLTKNWLPDDFRPAYGGDPWSAKVFLQIGGMKMWGDS